MDPDIQLCIPDVDVPNPELSIVVPALNEALTIGDFIDWCHEGMKKAKVTGEILIIDSSKDKTADIALSKGARVLRTPKRGLGRAYIDGLEFIRGKYVLMGDCDCTYDFRELKPFVDKFREGKEFIMGSRFKGYIESGSMPVLHQYFGTPITTAILNFIYSSHFSDIHCGMRGITAQAFHRMGLASQSWEYASEMVLKSVHMELKMAEVPIRFLKDREGRLSHHKRAGWFSPWQAAWINLKAMFIYGADFFLFKPGLLLYFLGVLITLCSWSHVSIGPITFSLYWMLFGLGLSILGVQCIYAGIIAQVILDFTGKATNFWLQIFSYTRSTLISAILFFSGALLCIPLVALYVRSGFQVHVTLQSASYNAILGIFFTIMGFINFTSTLLMHAIHYRTSNRQVHNWKPASIESR